MLQKTSFSSSQVTSVFEPSMQALSFCGPHIEVIAPNEWSWKKQDTTFLKTNNEMGFFLLSSNIQAMYSNKVQQQHQNMLQKSCQILQDFQKVVNKHPQKGTIHLHRQCLLMKKRKKIRKANEELVYISLPHPEQSSSEPSLNLNLPLTKMPLDLRSRQLSYSVWCAPLKFSIIGWGSVSRTDS